MKVLDVLTESKKVNEGPLRFLKRTLGKNTAMGKSAQLDVEIDKEVKNIYKDYVAVSKQDPCRCQWIAPRSCSSYRTAAPSSRRLQDQLPPKRRCNGSVASSL